MHRQAWCTRCFGAPGGRDAIGALEELEEIDALIVLGVLGALGALGGTGQRYARGRAGQFLTTSRSPRATRRMWSPCGRSRTCAGSPWDLDHRHEVAAALAHAPRGNSHHRHVVVAALAHAPREMMEGQTRFGRSWRRQAHSSVLQNASVRHELTGHRRTGHDWRQTGGENRVLTTYGWGSSSQRVARTWREDP